MGELRSVRLRPAFRGRDGDTDPSFLPVDRAAEIVDLVPGTPGPLRARGPARGAEVMVDPDPFTTAEGAWVGDNGDVLYHAGATKQLIRVRRDESAYPPTLATTVVPVTGDAFIPSGRAAPLATGVYGFSTYGALMRWDSLGTLTSIGTGPADAIDSIAHLQRLFVLGGRAPNATVPQVNENGLYYSDIGGPAANVAEEWEDDYTGLVNQIVLPSSEGKPTGLGQIGQNLAIFYQKAIFVLYGQTPAQFSLRKVVARRGCINKSTIVSYNDVVFFLSADGFCYFDGSSVSTVSGPVSDVVRNCRNRQWAGITSDPFLASAVFIHPESILLSLLEDVSYARSVFQFHIPTGSWSRVSVGSTGFSRPQYGLYLMASAPTWTFGWDGQRAWDLTEIADTAVGSLPDERGTDSYAAKTNTTVTLRHNIVYRTRTVELSRPEQKVQLNRFHVDYWLTYPQAIGPVGSPLLFSVVLTDPETGAELSRKSIPAVSGVAQRRRASFDCFEEATSVQVTITLQGTSTILNSAYQQLAEPPAIGDIVIEYQVSHRTT